MNLSPKTFLYLNVVLLFVFTYNFFSRLFLAFKSTEFDYLRLSITGAALIFTVYQIIKYSKIINNSDDK